jgi:hypothetical protein
MGEAAGRMLWPALKGDHDLTAMAVMRAEQGKVQGHHI